MSAPRSFKMAAKKAADQPEFESVPYELVDSDGEKRIVTAKYPGDGPLTLMMASSVDEENPQMALSELFALLQVMFEAEDFKFLKARMRANELTFEMMMEMVMDAVEQWSSFPTKPGPGFSDKPQLTGTRSTGRAPGRGSTRSTSPSADS